MRSIVKTYFWIVQALGMATVMSFAGSALATHLGARLIVAHASKRDEPSRPGGAFGSGRVETEQLAASRYRERTRAKRGAGEDILTRNVFCPTCAPESVRAASQSAEPVPAPRIVETQLPLRLAATMEASDPERSLATICDAQSGGCGLYGHGEWVRPRVQLVAVASGYVRLRHDAQLEYLEIGEPDPPPKIRASGRKSKKKRRRKRRRRRSRAIPGAEEAIDCQGPSTCIIERAFVDRVMSNPALLSKQARIAPHQSHGETDGFRFFGMRRGTLPRLLGLKNGDVLKEVNGHEIRSLDQAMSLAMRLRHARNLSVTVERRGRTVSKDIIIR